MDTEKRIKLAGEFRTSCGAYRAAVCVALPALVLLAAGLSLVGCSKDAPSWWGSAPREVEVTLPSLAVGDAVTVEPMGSRAPVAGAAGTAGASSDNDALFTVSLGPDEGMSSSVAAASPATRADVALTNVWVLQFDAAGATKACVRVGTVTAGQKVKAVLQSGEGYTVWIVANGPASGGLTTSNPATLADFENKMLYTATPASDELIPLTGRLTGVRILDNGQVLVGSDNAVVPEVTLTRTMARIDVVLEYNVSGAELDGVWLYQVPVGACYGLDPAATGFPASDEVSNFGYRTVESEGFAPMSSGSGTVTHTWYVGDNRRGQVPTIQWEKNKGENNAPAMATYARIKSHESADVNKALFHDVYLGGNVTTDFDVLRNRHYIYRVRIGGTLDQQKLLAERDDRVWAGELEYLSGAPVVTPSLSAEIHPNGQAFTVKFNGYWTGEGIPVRATVGGTKLAEGSAVCMAGNTGEATLEIPENESGAERQILFEYQWKGKWMAIGIGTQPGYNVSNATHNAPATIPGQGGTYRVTLTGNLPASGVDVRASSGGTVLVTGKVTASGTPVSLNIPANTTGAARTVMFEYKLNGTWNNIAPARTQATSLVGTLYGGGVIYWVNPDDENDFRVVALDQEASSALKWAPNADYVLGSGAQSTTERNGADVWKIAKQYSDNKTGGASGVFATDFPAFSYCYEKTDGGVSKGTWYLPSIQELVDLYSAKGSVESVITANGGTAFSAAYYWSATEDSSHSACVWLVYFSNGGTSSSGKPGTSVVRCVRDH